MGKCNIWIHFDFFISTMKCLAILTITILLGFSFALPSKNIEEIQGKRLIKTSENEPGKWLTQEEILSTLIRNKVHFMDITDHQTRKSRTQSSRDYPEESKYQSIVNDILPSISNERMESFIQNFSSFNNRYYTSSTGLQSTEWLLSQINEVYDNSDYSGTQVVIEPFKHSWAQESLIARIQGSDPDLESEILIMGAHLDSVNSLNPVNGRSPGADDNASGSAVLLETFRLLMNSGFVPKRTIEFQWYAAEEVGLRGSQDIAKSYKADGKNVIAMNNFDVVGYTKANTNYDIGILTDYADSSLNEFVRLIIDTYCTISKWRNYVCGYGCSDHASWDSYGFPATSPSEYDLSPFMHTTKDTIDTVNFLYVNQFVRLAVGFVVELAEPSESPE